MRFHFTSRIARLTTASWFIFALCPGADVAGAGSGKPLPAFGQVEQFVKDQFAALDGFRAGDVISDSQVIPVLDGLAELGWKVPDRDKIQQAVLPDGSFLVRELRTKPGRRFAPQLARIPQGYERLDRLSQLPRGKQTVHDLIRAKDGYKLIQYMNEAQGGRNLNKMLARTPAGGNFNQPTDKIYTVNQLLDRLRLSYEMTAAGP